MAAVFPPSLLGRLPSDFTFSLRTEPFGANPPALAAPEFPEGDSGGIFLPLPRRRGRWNFIVGHQPNDAVRGDVRVGGAAALAWAFRHALVYCLMPPTDNRLYYGDNLDVLRRHIADESVDLVYLDPPFNSNASYNVLFSAKDGTQAAAQIRAFTDTWEWDEAAAAAYQEAVEAGGKVAEAMIAFRTFLGGSDMLAYLSMMAPRLVELHHTLKDTGSIYLHCDPTASHYLKLLLDAVFGPEHFRNEIVWERFGSHNDPQRFGRVTDSILFYTKSDDYTFNPVRRAYSEAHLTKRFRYSDHDGRRFWPNTMLAPGGRGPRYEWHGHTRNWRFTRENMEKLEAGGEIYYSAKGMPYRKNYLDRLKGQLVQNLWTDIKMTKSGHERLGYPTQKPLALLERIIGASSNPGDLVLDPFCGCGTTIDAAQKLKRRWIGIDITHLAISLIKTRLHDSYRDLAKYEVIGEPTTVEDAAILAASDPYQFQWWAVGKAGAPPMEKKKGADKGIDGRIYFHDGTTESRQIILSVKAGKVHREHVHSLGGVIQREKADIGVLISFEEPTKPMRQEAASAGFYESPWGRHPRIQLLTVGELLAGKRIDYPQTGERIRVRRSKPKPSGGDRTLFDPYSEPRASKVAEPIRPPFDKDDLAN